MLINFSHGEGFDSVVLVEQEVLVVREAQNAMTLVRLLVVLVDAVELVVKVVLVVQEVDSVVLVEEVLVVQEVLRAATLVVDVVLVDNVVLVVEEVLVEQEVEKETLVRLLEVLVLGKSSMCWCGNHATASGKTSRSTSARLEKGETENLSQNGLSQNGYGYTLLSGISCTSCTAPWGRHRVDLPENRI
eukprot:3707528-Amphidinium_carterae.1